jgi:hypothetical protein
MNTKMFVICLCLSGLLLTSCDPNEINNDSKNYWEQNAWVRMQLKGKVKTLTVEEQSTNVIQFSENGMINSKTTTSMGEYGGTTIETNTYSANGNLIKTITESNYNLNSYKDTVSYEYGTHGKYIPNSGFHIWMSGLTPNLTAIIATSYRTDYAFKGNDLYIINTSKSTMEKDTTIFAFSGKYPVSTETSWSFVENLTYANNGMFLTYTEGFKSPNSRTTRVYTFKVDADYLLLDSESETYVDTMNPEYNSSDVTNFEYNDKKDLIRTSRGESIEEYFNYVYDANGNWTSRQYRSKYDANSTWSASDPVTRTIVYW